MIDGNVPGIDERSATALLRRGRAMRRELTRGPGAHPGAQTHKAIELLAQGDRYEHRAVALLKEAARAGYAEARYELGNVYGRGDARDTAKAIKHLRIAADVGHAEAQFALAVECDNAEDGHADPETAARYFKLAADRGHVDAQFNAAICYETGSGVDADPAMAAHYYKLAADERCAGS